MSREASMKHAGSPRVLEHSVVPGFLWSLGICGRVSDPYGSQCWSQNRMMGAQKVLTADSGADTSLLHRFTTRKGRQVCANPDARWVKEYINFLELQ